MACYNRKKLEEMGRNKKKRGRNKKKQKEAGRKSIVSATLKRKKMYRFSNPEDKNDIASATLKTEGITVEASGLAEHFTNAATLKTQNFIVAPTLRTEIFICPRHAMSKLIENISQVVIDHGIHDIGYVKTWPPASIKVNSNIPYPIY